MIDLQSDSSTASAPWFFIIQGFYIEAKIAFLDEWKRACEIVDREDFPEGDEPTVWKTIGDEILFTKVLTDYRQLTLVLKCWVAALGTIRSFLKTRDSRLDVKSTAWVAGFPVKNKDVVLSNSPALLDYKEDNYLVTSGKLLNKYYTNPATDDVTVDFVGPSVDVGFRLAAHASARRFVVSVGIPYIISLTTPTVEDTADELLFHFSGTVSLKGVFGGAPYPLFWIDMGVKNTLATLEDPFTKISHCDPRDVRKYCDAFYKEQNNYTFKPFIAEDGEHKLKQTPSWYEMQLNRLIDEFNNPSTLITSGADPKASVRSKKTATAEDITATAEDIIAKLSFLKSNIDR